MSRQNSYRRFDTADTVELNMFESKVQASRDCSADHPDTTKKELWAWYLFGFGLEPFSVACIAIFIPLILEDLAWKAGTSNYKDPSFPPCALRNSSEAASSPCFVKFLGWTSPESFAFYIASISVGIQVFSFITFGSFADHGKFRKVLLMIFGTIQIIATVSFLLVFSPDSYGFAAFLSILGNVAFGTSFVFYNAYLPLLVDAHPELRSVKAAAESKIEEARVYNSDLDSVPGALDIVGEHNMPVEFESEINNVRESLTNKISTMGYMVGYSGGVLVLLGISALVYFYKDTDTTYVMQIGIALSGLWFMIFLVGFVAPWLEIRPGPDFKTKGILNMLSYGWRKTGKTIAKCYKLRNLFYTLVSWFFYSDGLSTVGMVAILYAKSVFAMTTDHLLIIAVLAPLLAVVGNIFFLKVFHQWLKFNSKQMVLMLLLLMCLIPIYGVLGIVIPQHIPFGLHTPTEMFIMASYFGFVIGALQSFSRVLFAELIPPGLESEFFALYEITDRGSSFVGPLLVGAIKDATGRLQYGFFALLVLFILGLPFLLKVDLKAGKKEAKEFVVEQVE